MIMSGHVVAMHNCFEFWSAIFFVVLIIISEQTTEPVHLVFVVKGNLYFHFPLLTKFFHVFPFLNFFFFLPSYRNKVPIALLGV